jgi:uncharacterized membrane protein YccC
MLIAYDAGEPEGAAHRMVSTHFEQARRRAADAARWYGAHDRGLLALRRATRTAIVMPAVTAIGDEVVGDAHFATFAAFGAFALLLLVDFGGPMRARLQAQALLSAVGAVFIVVGTLASRNPWSAAAAMVLVGFGVLFVGVVSSVLAGATTSLLLAFILPVSLRAPVSEIPARLEGWALAAAVSLAAVAFLWPAPAEDRLRTQAAATCRALGARLRTEVARLLADGEPDPAAEAAQADAVAAADGAVSDLNRLFLATPYRPTGLSTSARATVRLVDELQWLNAVLIHARPTGQTPPNRTACAVKSAAASVLEHGADLLDRAQGDPGPLRAALSGLGRALTGLEQEATSAFPDPPAWTGDGEPASGIGPAQVIASLDPSFRAQELSFVAGQVGANIDLAAAADRRTWGDRILGRRPPGLGGTLSAAQERAAAHVERHSVWLHNSVRGAVGLGTAVLVADLTGVQHSFWVVLGTLSVLRSNALNTGQNAMRAVLGTVVGFAVGSGLLEAIGNDTALLWVLLPLAIVVAGVAPAAISFAAGQAGFTLVLVILFNLAQPTGWQVGLVRVEDIGLGCGVSLLVGALFWPRGAAAALNTALAEAYTDSARYLGAAVEFGVRTCDRGVPDPVIPARAAARAAAAARRMDDTFRGYLAERGTKTLPLAEVARLVTGVVGLRLAADAVLDLWRREDGRAEGDRTAAGAELVAMSAAVTGWYAALADNLARSGPAPTPLAGDEQADDRLVRAVGRDLRGADGLATATAVRMIWTGDHLDAARRLQAGLLAPPR